MTLAGEPDRSARRPNDQPAHLRADAGRQSSQQIVVGVDGSSHSRRALEWAIEEAQLKDAEVTAVFAWQFPLIGVPGAFERDELEAQAKQFLTTEVAATQPPPELTISTLVAQGDPSASLLAACENTQADLLVIGARGREGFIGLLLGSVGQECAVHAPCPVLIVKDQRDGRSRPRAL
jgi:nucleotide-binding universal stress UspA family protein